MADILLTEHSNERALEASMELARCKVASRCLAHAWGRLHVWKAKCDGMWYTFMVDQVWLNVSTMHMSVNTIAWVQLNQKQYIINGCVEQVTSYITGKKYTVRQKVDCKSNNLV